MSRLARHYKRMLALYPRDHRERNGDEMLDVLLADAGDRTNPQFRETLDLLWGALRLHLRRAVAADGGVDTRDVLAIVSLLGPIAILAGATTAMHELGWWVMHGFFAELPWWRQIPDAPMWVAWFVIAVLVLFGLRRTAAAGAWLATAGFVVLAVTSMTTGWRWTTADAGWVLLSALTAVALTWSPGPARGRELVRTRGLLVIASTVVVAGVLGVVGYGSDLVAWAWVLVLVAGAVVACGAGSRVGRRAALILSTPVMTLLIAQVAYDLPFRLTTRFIEAVLFYGVPAVVLLALGGLPRRYPRRAR